MGNLSKRAVKALRAHGQLIAGIPAVAPYLRRDDPTEDTTPAFMCAPDFNPADPSECFTYILHEPNPHFTCLRYDDTVE